MANMFTDALVAGQQEANDLGGAISNYNDINQLGKQKEALIQLSSQVGMPKGYEAKINMAKNPDDLAMSAKEILSYQGRQESFGRIKSGVQGGVDAVSAISMDDELLKMGITPESSTYDRNKAMERVNQMKQSAGTDAIIGSEDFKTLDELKSSLDLYGAGGDGSKAAKMKLERERMEGYQGKWYEDWKEKQRKRATASLGKGFGTLSDNMNIMGSVKDTLAESVGTLGDTSEEVAEELKSSRGPRLLGIYSVRKGLTQNVLNKAGETFGWDSVKMPSVKQEAMQSLFTGMVNDYIKAMSGAAVTDNERQMYMKQFGIDATSRDEQFYNNLAVEFAKSRNRAENYLKRLQEIGSDTYTGVGSYQGTNSSEAFKQEMQVLENNIQHMKDSEEFFKQVIEGREAASNVKTAPGGNKPKERKKETALERLRRLKKKKGQQ